jgi:hypothetical protein
VLDVVALDKEVPDYCPAKSALARRTGLASQDVLFVVQPAWLVLARVPMNVMTTAVPRCPGRSRCMTR